MGYQRDRAEQAVQNIEVFDIPMAIDWLENNSRREEELLEEEEIKMISI